MYTYYQTKLDTKNTITITEARKNIFRLADEVQKTNTHFTLTEGGKAKAVLMSAEEFDSWMETLEVMWEFPNLKQDLEEAERDFKAGRTISLEDLLKKEKLDDLLNPLEKGRERIQKTAKRVQKKNQ